MDVLLYDNAQQVLSPNSNICDRYYLEQSISVLRDIGWYFFIFIQILIEHSSSKRWRP